MKPRNRSLTGAVIAVLVLPVFAGLLACIPSFPVPIGNPEKSRIDADISGMWLSDDEDGIFVYLFEPFDKRTWLISAVEVIEDLDYCDFETEPEGDEEKEDEDDSSSSYETNIKYIEKYGSDCFEVGGGTFIMKAWRTKLGGEWFMTWEGKGGFSATRGFEAEEWLVFRIDKAVPGQLRLWWMDEDHVGWDVLDDIDEKDRTRRQHERVIRKHAGDEEFYSDEPIFTFYRVKPEHYELFEDFTLEGMLE
jgi:hypothetical protein